ncbi:hypothetical protein C1Y08_29500 [Pseudomonas sp. FW306-02-F02-AA]|uniref:Uncharacterized protein n=1 Tax=Pseudomonas fluorescens TaxID=294 RepID=A0A0N9WWG0_PSEFL|nr:MULTISPECIES: hypothetical protein [Pseudomonas]ALI02518.1 hypothetical protein AO353_16085 [Pseudomonas fluorescens]PMZ00624.1 hypothetical protein C1Y07_29455 [Pseudomonas sp. FW306-02-F02-AB]PMZ06520.1 hypothetical protein C1Y06_29445 [Pseudomonas sp. FW306-02-H06C]PMZ12345.1 hypothetical protein C1Y08_29500 [Pseudomonas sp. FW306-02-F02-AA]PMZ18334.1 hypothetical protein C1Y09_29805 [Pseudomonas sp. FW306-02-F08-AA]
MNVSTVFPWRSVVALFIGACLVVSSLQAVAVVLPITATFNPDPSNPQKNEFKNTTRNVGFCWSYPAICKSYGIFSLRSHVNVGVQGAIQPNQEDVRKGAMIKTPAAWRALTVLNRETGELATVEVRIAGMGGVYRLSDSAMELTGEPEYVGAHTALWGSDWRTAPGPCVAIGTTTYYGPTGFQFFWLTPEETVCGKQAKFLIPGFGYESLDFTYELRTPDPLKMSTGVYQGTQVYSIGPGGDFDLGDVVAPSDNIIQLDFTLTVEHTLKVEIPPGGNRIELVPQGGWQAWLQQGRKPTRLFRDQTFNISASSRFKMNLECEYTQDGKTCSLREPVTGHAVPLNVSVSLPPGLTDAGGQSVSRQQLLRDGSTTKMFQPGVYVDRKPGTLHFEIPSSEVAEMIRPGSQRQYSGSVTVIWDSEV